MHIVFAASEGVPFSKTGGLADVVGALPRTLASSRTPGKRLSAALPPDLAQEGREGGQQHHHTLRRSLPLLFRGERWEELWGAILLCRLSAIFRPRCALWNFLRRLSRQRRAFCPIFPRRPGSVENSGAAQIFHCHDWQAALIPVLLRTQYAEDPAFRDAATVFTIHNMGYQGLFPPDTLPLLTLPWDLFTISKMEFFGNVNFLKGALVFSDFITTVSKKYSQEIQTTEFGFGLEGVLRTRSSTVTGILNGVDYDEWSPETDKFTIARYSAQDLSGKTKCREDLLASFDIPKADARLPVIGIVSRFAAQKGFDLIAQIMERLAREEMIIVALGSGDKTYEEMFLRLSKQFPQKIAVKVAYDNTLAHKIEAGSDMFLMPSKYEPCGLNQIYSLKYGTVPIVRATGGLDDTIEHWDARTGKGTGFKFTDCNGEALLLTIREALRAYRDQTSWQQLMRNGMSKDFSWTASGREYIRVYERARQLRTGNPASTPRLEANDLEPISR